MDTSRLVRGQHRMRYTSKDYGPVHGARAPYQRSCIVGAVRGWYSRDSVSEESGKVSTSRQREPFPGLRQIMDRRDYETAGWPPAVVASVFQTGLNLMRDLEQRKVKTVGVDCNPHNPGFRSRYGRSYLCPNPDKEPEAWVEFMVSLAEAMGERPVLIAASDIFVSAIGRHVARLKE